MVLRMVDASIPTAFSASHVHSAFMVSCTRRIFVEWLSWGDFQCDLVSEGRFSERWLSMCYVEVRCSVWVAQYMFILVYWRGGVAMRDITHRFHYYCKYPCFAHEFCFRFHLAYGKARLTRYVETMDPDRTESLRPPQDLQELLGMNNWATEPLRNYLVRLLVNKYGTEEGSRNISFSIKWMDPNFNLKLLPHFSEHIVPV